MAIKSGDRISYRLLTDARCYTAAVLSVDEGNIALELDAETPAGLRNGRYLAITETDGDVEYFGEIGNVSGPTVRLSRMWSGKRGYFRVDDVFPLTYRRMDDGAPLAGARIFSGYSEDLSDLSIPDASINPQLWKLLVDISAKLNLVLKHLEHQNEGITKAEPVPVNISASGIRLILDQKLDLNDVYQLKMFLPSYPPVGIMVHGRVVRVHDGEHGKFSVSFCFVDLTDEVQDVIIQYTLKRQRETVRLQRDQEHGG